MLRVFLTLECADWSLVARRQLMTTANLYILPWRLLVCPRCSLLYRYLGVILAEAQLPSADRNAVSFL